jgi:uncharacterized protein YbjT (DUF2867 family)
MKKILIAGATGYLGRYVTREFKKRNYWIRALARRDSSMESILQEIDDVFIGEVTHPDSLSGICDGMDIVFSSIGITRQKDGLSYMDVDYQGNINILHEAQKHKVGQFIYISALNGPDLRHLKMIDAKEQFVEALKASGIPYTIIRPNGFYSDMLEYLKMARKGKGYVFGSGDYKINPIHGQDLAEVCADATNNQQTEIDVGGPEILTHNMILELAFQMLGKKVKISKIPLWFRNVLLELLRSLTPVRVYGPLEFFMTVLATDMIAPQYGRISLKKFFEAELLAGRRP